MAVQSHLSGREREREREYESGKVCMRETKLMYVVLVLLALYICDVPRWSQPVDISGASG